MEIDILMLPIKVSIGLVLWTIGLLIYRVFQAVIDRKKTHWKQRAKHKTHSGAPHDDATPPNCSHPTGEYFLKSCETCSSTDAIFGGITHASKSDAFWISPDPGYSQFDDTLHGTLTGLEISQNSGAEASRTKRPQTVLDVEDSSSSASTVSTSPGQETLNSDCSFIDESLSGSDAFKKKISCSDDTRIRITNHTNTNNVLIDPRSQFSHQISIIPDTRSPGFPGERFNSSKYGKLNKSLNKPQTLENQRLASPPKIVTHKEKTLLSDFASVNPNSLVSELKNLLNERLHVNENAREKANPSTDDIPIPTLANTSPPIEHDSPTIHIVLPSISDSNMIKPPGAGPQHLQVNTDNIIPTDADSGYAQHDSIFKEMPDCTNLEGSNSRLKTYNMADDYRQKIAYIEALPPFNIPPYITPRVQKSPISYSNGSSLNAHFGNTHCFNSVDEKLPHFDSAQKIIIPSTVDNQMQIYDQETADQLGSFSPAFSVEPSIEPVILDSDGAALSDRLQVQDGLTEFGEKIHWELAPINISQEKQTPVTEQLQIVIPDGNNITGFSEATTVPLVSSDFQGHNRAKLVPKCLGYAQKDIKSHEGLSGDIFPDEKHLPEDLKSSLSYYDAVIRTLETSPTSMTFISGDNSPIQHPSSLVQNTTNSFGGAIASTANGSDFISWDDPPDSGQVKLQTFSVDNKTAGRYEEPTLSKSTVDDPDFLGGEGSDICGIEKRQAFSADQETMNRDREVLRSVIIGRRRSSTNSSDIWSASEDSFSFSSSCSAEN